MNMVQKPVYVAPEPGIKRTIIIARAKRKSLWDSRMKTNNMKRDRAMYAYFKGRRTDLEDFLY